MCDAFLCPITHAVMLDPVVDAAGITYERHAIVEWLQTNSTDPATRCVLEHRALVPNVALRSQIDDHVKAQGVPSDWVGYADVLSDIAPLLKLARLGIVTPAAVTAVQSAQSERHRAWTRVSASYERAARRARMLERQVTAAGLELQATTSALKEIRAEAKRLGGNVS